MPQKLTLVTVDVIGVAAVEILTVAVVPVPVATAFAGWKGDDATLVASAAARTTFRPATYNPPTSPTTRSRDLRRDVRPRPKLATRPATRARNHDPPEGCTDLNSSMVNQRSKIRARGGGISENTPYG